MSYKVYVIGSQSGYARWIEGELVNKISNADVVFLTGGEDINPALYGQKANKHTYYSNGRDSYEIPLIEEALKQGKPMWGTCRGLQMLTAVAGGELIQHLSHPGRHDIITIDGTVVPSNSIHHQMAYPFGLPDNEYTVLAWANGLSGCHLNGDGQEMDLPVVNGFIQEPEMVWYSRINGLGIQGHPEMMPSSSLMVRMCKAYLDHQIAGTLDLAIKLNIGIERLVDRNFKFTIEELQQDGVNTKNGQEKAQEETKQRNVATTENTGVYGV